MKDSNCLKGPDPERVVTANRRPARIIETDNFGGDYPGERFVNLPLMTREHATRVADAINSGFPDGCSRYWRVVDDGYTLRPGFEP